MQSNFEALESVRHTTSREKAKKVGAKAVVGSMVASLIATFSGILPAGAEVLQKPKEEKTQQAVNSSKQRYKHLDGYNPEKDKTLGNIRLARILPGEEYMTLERPSGQKVNVPYLRDNGDPNSTAESVLALFAAYLTTDSKKALRAFSSNPEVKNYLKGLRKEFKIEEYQHTEGGDFAQVAIFDLPDAPAVFTESTDEQGRRIFTLSSGTLYLNGTYKSGDSGYTDIWQGKETRLEPAPAIFQELSFWLNDANGRLSVDGFARNNVENPNR